jgi:hypothetical protein
MFDSYCRRQQLESESYKHKVMLTLKSSLIQEKRKEASEKAAFKHKTRLFAERWIKSAFT